MSKDAYGKENKTMIAMNDDDLMSFGKHKNKKMVDIPANYLLWLFDQDWLKAKYPFVWGYIYNSRAALDKEKIEIPKPKTRVKSYIANYDEGYDPDSFFMEPPDF